MMSEYFGVDFVDVVFPAAEPRILILVVAAPVDHAGVVAQAFDVVDGLQTHVLQQRPFGRVDRAGVHEILPDQDALAVAKLIEEVVFVDAAAPDPEHVHVDVDRVPDRAFVGLAGDAGQEAVAGDVVGALAENGFAVEQEPQAASVGVGLLLDGDGAGARPVRCGRPAHGRQAPRRYGKYRGAVRPCRGTTIVPDARS